jgi:hypothetical protein
MFVGRWLDAPIHSRDFFNRIGQVEVTKKNPPRVGVDKCGGPEGVISTTQYQKDLSRKDKKYCEYSSTDRSGTGNYSTLSSIGDCCFFNRILLQS